MVLRQQTFRDVTYSVIRGTQHPDYSYYTFESEEVDFRNKYWQINKNDIVFDIGASYGSYTLSACAMGAKVYSFEPEPLVFKDLITNVAINNWQDNCFAFNIGLWDSEAVIDMKSYAPHWAAYLISQKYSMRSLDQLVKLNNIKKLDWIKIDVEGAEEKVIKGGTLSINRFKPKLLIECHVFLDANIINNIKNMLLTLGDYEFIEENRPPCILLYASVISKKE